jgi:nucleoid-associated protein YgaU
MWCADRAEKGTTTMNSSTETTTATQTAAVSEQGAPVAPTKGKATRKPTARKAAPKAAAAAAPAKAAARAQKAAKAVPAKAKASKTTKAAKKAAKATPPREFSKKAIVLDMLRAKGGATMAEIAKATDWQNHTIRGFISGTLTKKMGLAIESTKTDAGERCYRIDVK